METLITTDGSITAIRTADGLSLSIPPDGSFKAMITGGSNPYDWVGVEIVQTPSGQLEPKVSLVSSILGRVSGNNPSTFTYDAVYERNGISTVVPGTIITVRPRTARNDDKGTEYEFDASRDLLIPAKITHVGAPDTILNGAISATATSINVDDTTGFPGRGFFYILIDEEVVQVQDTTPNGGQPWTSCVRGVDGTIATAHADNAPVYLVDQYEWFQVIPPTSGNDSWTVDPGGLDGTWNVCSARERNSNCQVPDDTYVLLQRRYRDGAGTGTLSNAMTDTDTTIAASTTGMPTVFGTYYLIRIDGEIMTNDASQRGLFGTQATAHEIGASIYEAIAEWVFDYCCKPIPNPFCSVERSSNFQISGTEALVTMDTVIYDPYELYNSTTGRITIKSGMDGVYYVSAFATFDETQNYPGGQSYTFPVGASTATVKIGMVFAGLTRWLTIHSQATAGSGGFGIAGGIDTTPKMLVPGTVDQTTGDAATVDLDNQGYIKVSGLISLASSDWVAAYAGIEGAERSGLSSLVSRKSARPAGITLFRISQAEL